MSEERTTAEILRAAKARIANQGHFVMGALAWNRRGRNVDPSSDDVWRWNARGAICVESGERHGLNWDASLNGGSHLLYRLLDRAAADVAKANGIQLPVGKQFADNLGHALTLQALEDAAVLAESGEAP